MPEKSLINVKYLKILLLFLFTVSGLNARNAALLYNPDFNNTHPSVNKELQKWEYLLLKWGIGYELVPLDDFDGSDIDEYYFAIGFNLRTASLSEFRELSEFALNGGSLILDASVFDEKNRNLISNDEFWNKYFSVKISELKSESSNFILNSDTPISRNKGGSLFPVRKKNISFDPNSVNIFSAGYFENANDKTALIYGTLDSGKIVWFGFDVDFFSLNNEASKNLKNAVKNSFDWLTGKPQIWLSRWPGNYSSAVSFVCEVPPNSLGAFKSVRFFRDENIRPTFVLQTENVYDKDLLKKFIETGEIAFNFDSELSKNKSSVSALFGAAVKNFKKINKLKKFRAVKGIRLKNASYLSFIEKKNRLPFEYVIVNGKSDVSGFKILDNQIALLSVSGLNVNGNRSTSGKILNALSLADNTHGLFVVSFVSSSFLQSGNLFYDFLNDLNERNCWVATLGQISDRLKTNDNISIEYSLLENGDVEVAVENNNAKTVFGVQIFLNEFFENYQIKNENINGKYYQTDKKLTKLIINKIKYRQKEFIKLHKVNMVVKN